ncbi:MULTISPECIES: hypothetical protein [Halorussus]|uniref:hypothetical protein n=1 Tax=Halorussus TaxID=1070314 RepID=UPI000E2131F3|nr:MULTISPECIES: hypothetical protein [Halorussus]NHN59460.1 hypothetical protein [Halorussus sp. JP-T4]
MYLWHATWTPDGDSDEERRVRFEADYDRLGDSGVIRRAYRATRRQKVVDEYALTRYWRLADLTGTYAAIADTLGEKSYPELTAWLAERPEVLEVRPRTPVVDAILESREDGPALKRALQERLDADVSAIIDRTSTQKPGSPGVVGQFPRLQLKTEFDLGEAVERHASEE